MGTKYPPKNTQNGRYSQQIRPTDIDIVKTNLSLKSAGLKVVTEGFITVPPDT